MTSFAIVIIVRWWQTQPYILSTGWSTGSLHGACLAAVRWTSSSPVDWNGRADHVANKISRSYLVRLLKESIQTASGHINARWRENSCWPYQKSPQVLRHWWQNIRAFITIEVILIIRFFSNRADLQFQEVMQLVYCYWMINNLLTHFCTGK